MPPQSISHGSFLRIVTSQTRPVSAVQPKAPLPKGRRAAAVNFPRQLSTHRYFPDPPGIGGAAVTEGFTVGDFSKAPTRVDTCQPGESPRLGVAEAPPFRKGGFDAAKLRRLPSYKNYITKTINQYFYEVILC